MAPKSTAPAVVNPAAGKVPQNAEEKAGTTAPETTENVTEQVQAPFVKQEKLGPVKGRGRRAAPVPPKEVEKLERSLASCEGTPGNDGFKESSDPVTPSQLTTLKNAHKKWKAQKEREGIIVTIAYRTDPENKPTADNPAPVEYAVTFVGNLRS